ncbi:MAG: recombinase family protein [Anaerobacillus sp.]|uniref:recombinase family protein n=1 Tax=Anaerobacillus sp. TaxID=1872506 RepID=UPI00391AB697
MELPRKVNHAICYLRRSRQDEEREKKLGIDTLHEQRQLMIKELAKYDFFYEVREEIGSGDTISSREIFKSIIFDIENNKVDAICVKDFSRMGRGDFEDAGRIYKMIQKFNILIITPNKIYNPLNSSDLQQMRFEMFLYREEFELIKKRLTNARHNYAREGKWMTGGAGIPYGYKYNDRTQKLEPEPNQASVVHTIFHWYTEEDIGLQAICSRLKKKGILTATGKQDWKQIVIRRLLSNEVYIGTVRFRTTKRIDGKVVDLPAEEHIIVPNAHKPIIDISIFEKAHEKLKNQKKMHPVRTDFSPGILAGIITCPHCKRKLLKNTSNAKYKKQDGSTSYYKREFISCIPCSVYVKYDDVVNAILEYLKQLSTINEHELRKEIDNQVMRENQKNNTFSEHEYINLEKQKELIRKKRSFLLDKYLEGNIEDNIYQQKDHEFKDQLNGISHLIDELLKEKAATSDDSLNLNDFKIKIVTIIDVYNHLHTNEKKNELLRELIEYAELHVIEKGRGRKPAKFKLIIRPSVNCLQ